MEQTLSIKIHFRENENTLNTLYSIVTLTICRTRRNEMRMTQDDSPWSAIWNRAKDTSCILQDLIIVVAALLILEAYFFRT